MDQIFPNKVKFHLLIYLFIVIAKYIFSIAAMEIIFSRTYFSLLYELFKIEVQKLRKNGTGLNVFHKMVHFLKNLRFTLYA